MGAILVFVTKLILHPYWLLVFNKLIREFVIDINFEMGAALIGADVTAALPGILLARAARECTRMAAPFSATTNITRSIVYGCDFRLVDQTDTSHVRYDSSLDARFRS